MKFIFSFLIAIFLVGSTQAQTDSSITAKRCIAPALLITSGSILSLPSLSLKINLRDFIQSKTNNYRTTIDNSIQYAPIVELYAADLLGFQTKNTAWGHTKCLALSELGTAGITHLMKYAFSIDRPDGSNDNSFPSGHTSQAFTAATVLYLELKDTYPVYAYSGYVFATATGVLRMVNNKHWISDVLVGAGLGILVTNLIYYWHPLKNCCPRR